MRPSDPRRPPLGRLGLVSLMACAMLVAVVSGRLAASAAEAVQGPIPTATTAARPLYWCDSTDPAKLDLIVNRQGDKYYLTNAARYEATGKNCYYYVNWDLQGTHQAAKPIDRVEVEPNSLYLVHLYELSKPKTLRDFWSEDAGKQATAAVIWVGGEAHARAPVDGGAGTLEEIRESPRWFYYEKGDRLPFFSQRFPEFRLPTGKVLSLNMFRTQDTVDGYRRRGVTHFPGGGGERDRLPREQRLLTLNTGYLNHGIGAKPSSDPHVSSTEQAFLESDYSYAVGRAAIASEFDYLFLDEEFWHNDYQTATLERLCLFAREARRINPTLKLADFWSLPPYRFNFLRNEGSWTRDTVRDEALSHYDDADAAMKAGNQTMLRRVTVDGKQTSLAEELTAVSQCVYFDNLFGFIDQYDAFSIDYFVPAAIHTTRVNKRLPCNRGKPVIWFGMDILEGNYNHPRIAYPTRTTEPPGLAIFRDRLLVSPNFNEALALFGLLEGDGAYLWDAHGVSDGDPNGIFSTLKYCIDYKDDRGQWRPDVPGTAIGPGKTWYPPCMAYAADYYALGAWKYSQIADVIGGGQRVDFEYSMDGGKTWYIPPANGGAMADVVRDKRPVVTGAVCGADVAVVVFHPFQGVADTTSLLVRHGASVFAIELFGTRVRVYRGTTSAVPAS